MTTTLTEHDLRQFTRIGRLYRDKRNPDIVYSEGVRYVAERAGADWLLDEIAQAERYEGKVAARSLQIWTLTVRPDKTAMLTCAAADDEIVFTKELAFTDFPLPEISLWAIEDECWGGVFEIALASEF